MYEQTWPHKVHEYTYAIDPADRGYENSLVALTQATLQFIGSHSTVDVVFNEQRNPRARPSTFCEDLYFTSRSLEDVDGYDIEARFDNGNYVDTAKYRLQRPEMPGFMAPHAIAVSALSRTIYPQFRRTVFKLEQPPFDARHSLRVVAGILSDMRLNRYGIHGFEVLNNR
jgi:hypothetical protein